MATGSSGADFIAKSEGQDPTERGSNRPGGKGRGRGGIGRGGGRGELSRDVQVSKGLSKLLRHAAGEAGLPLDAEGFARVDRVMQWPRLKSLKVTFDEIKAAVADNDKKRFSMKPNPLLSTPPSLDSTDPADWVIRANQGHSVTVDSSALLIPITIEAGNIPDVVVHGTYYAFYQSIVESGGLKRMTRNHIHFSTGLPDDEQSVISGMRKDAQVLIYIDIKKSLADGIIWWLSENGVVLTAGDENGVLSTNYFQCVKGRTADLGILWQDGEKRAEMPEEFRNKRAPAGKEHRPRGSDRGGRGGSRGGQPRRGKES